LLPQCQILASRPQDHAIRSGSPASVKTLKTVNIQSLTFNTVVFQRWHTAAGKRDTERPPGGCEDTRVPQPQTGSLEYLTGATRGSAGVDLATVADITLENDKVQIVPSVVNGPLGYGLSALLIGCSSMSKQGLFVLPGLIDADYTGNIGIMVRALFPLVNIAAGTRIAQLIPFQSSVPKTKTMERGPHGFGSTDPPQIGKNTCCLARRFDGLIIHIRNGKVL
uniref:dUTPase-like domain-containing protein n=1 Tax=Gopherus agassizii TaxID=38772 RepID=A0A452GF94_9SAUR